MPGRKAGRLLRLESEIKIFELILMKYIRINQLPIHLSLGAIDDILFPPLFPLLGPAVDLSSAFFDFT